MSKKPYSWVAGAVLEEHSRRKHKVIAEYVARYLTVRCQLPQQSRFRLAIVDGFAGGGQYKCGSPGSPLIFINELRVATEQFNIKRQAEGMSPLDIECLLILNDFDKETVELLKTNAASLIAEIKENVPKLHLRVEYRNEKFDELYPEVKQLLERGSYHNVLFNLDQCGTGSVEINTIGDIVASFTSVEIFYTFGIQTLLTFLHQTDRGALARQLAPFGVSPDDLSQLDGLMTKDASIHNPDGWRYWLIHFANSVRARQEYNNILHQNSSAQAHFGRSGLHMLSYDPSEADSMLYMFDAAGRAEAKKQLHDDIPRFITNYGDAIPVGEFYASIYNATPAHMHDINSAIIENPDLEVITEQGGGERRKANMIKTSDILRLKQQRSFFPFFFENQSRVAKK